MIVNLSPSVRCATTLSPERVDLRPSVPPRNGARRPRGRQPALILALALASAPAAAAQTIEDMRAAVLPAIRSLALDSPDGQDWRPAYCTLRDLMRADCLADHRAGRKRQPYCAEGGTLPPDDVAALVCEEPR